jgi:hypothetical protein
MNMNWKNHIHLFKYLKMTEQTTFKLYNPAQNQMGYSSRHTSLECRSFYKIVPDGSRSLDAWCASDGASSTGQYVTINQGVKIYGIVLQGKTRGERIGYPIKVKAYKIVGNSSTPILFSGGSTEF